MAVQLKEGVAEELMDQFDVVITDLEVVVDEENLSPFPENLHKVVIQLNGQKEETEAVEVVKSVEVSTSEPLQKKTNKVENDDRIIQLLSNKWKIDEEIIELQLEGEGQGTIMGKGPLSWLKKQFSNEGDSSEKKKVKYPYLILVLLFGTGFMLVSNFLTNESTSNEAIPTFNNSAKEKQADVETFGQKNSEKDSLIDSYERSYEAQLKEALDTIVGVEDVTVVVNVAATEKSFPEK